MQKELTFATEADAAEILNIYSYYVKNTVITYEYDVPTLEEFTNRIRTISQRFPYLVYRIDGHIVGYAYASPFKTRAAFAWDAELSIYVNADYHRAGIGRKLYLALIDLLKAQGYHHLYAYISYPNEPSTHFHESLGFTTCAMYKNTGFKLGAWRDLVCMDLCLYPLNQMDTPKKTIPITALDHKVIDNILTSNH